MKFSKYIYKAVTPVMALFQKQHGLPFKQDYDNLRSTREESAASAGTAQSERQLHRNQSAVCASHNVPSDIQGSFYHKMSLFYFFIWSKISSTAFPFSIIPMPLKRSMQSTYPWQYACCASSEALFSIRSIHSLIILLSVSSI